MADRFPVRILDYWRAAVMGTEGAAGFRVSATLDARRPAMVLETVDGAVRAVVRPEIAARLDASGAGDRSVDGLRARLAAAGVALHDPDHLFYLPEGATPAGGGGARLLDPGDRAAFERFHAAASRQDRDDAFVEFDHPAVFGRFEGGRLVSAASLCLWRDGPIADLGVLTLAEARGRGHGRAVVDAITAYARRHGHEPQYRCQRDNAASVALARACGLTLFGDWTVAAGPCD